jgi:protein-S-isoprenylcysteine O-methyltransferase Ste14
MLSNHWIHFVHGNKIMTFELKMTIFLVVSGGLALLTWRSLSSFRSHGLYRLFAFISLLALVLLNLEYWFDEPSSIHQIISWILLFISIIFVTFGALTLHRGKPDSMRNNALLIGIEKTTELVTIGAYRYIRHPMYSSFMFGAWGVFFKHFSWLNAFFAVITTIFAVITAKKEEVENVRYFGEAYRDYMKRTKMFLPFFL